MKFSHLADVHIGAWRDPLMKNLTMESFRRAVKHTIDKEADFMIIAGDLFNTAVPAIDHLQETVILLKKLRDYGIPVYIVPGSHDCNASGKSILDVLEEAELLINVMKGDLIDTKLHLRFTIDRKTGAKLTGIGGRRGSLEKRDYTALEENNLESETGKKIFVFHTSIDEMKPEGLQVMQSIPIREFPKGFEYYAGGHVHVVQKADIDGRNNICYPGPIFPASFHELWNLGMGGFYFYDNGKIEHIKLNVKNTFKISIHAEGRTPQQVNDELDSKIKNRDFKDTIVMIFGDGKLSSGRVSEIDFKSAVKTMYDKGAFFAMRNTSHLESKDFGQEGIRTGSVEEIEEGIIADYHPNRNIFEKAETDVMKRLLLSLSDEQKDGEKKYEYDTRMKKEADSILGLQ